MSSRIGGYFPNILRILLIEFVKEQFDSVRLCIIALHLDEYGVGQMESKGCE